MIPTIVALLLFDEQGHQVVGSEDEEDSFLGDGVDWHLDVDQDIVALAVVELYLPHCLSVAGS